jgi:hypothetical protein
MNVATINVYFQNPAITRVVVFHMTRKLARPGRWRTNPHQILRSKDAALTDPTSPNSEENPWRAKFGLSNVKATEKSIFRAIGLDANGNQIVSFSAALGK